MHACTRYLIAAILSCCDIVRVSTRRSWTSCEESSNMQCLLWILKREKFDKFAVFVVDLEERRTPTNLQCVVDLEERRNFDKFAVFIVKLEERSSTNLQCLLWILKREGTSTNLQCLLWTLKREELRQIYSVCCGPWREKNFDKSAQCFLCLEEEESTSTALHWSSSYCAESCVHSPIWIIVVPSDFWERPLQVMFVGPHDDNGCQWKAKRESSEKVKEKVAAPLSVYVSIAEYMHIHRGVMCSQCVSLSSIFRRRTKLHRRTLSPLYMSSFLSLCATGALDGPQKLHKSTIDTHRNVQHSLHWTNFPARPDHVAKSPVNNQMRTIKGDTSR